MDNNQNNNQGFTLHQDTPTNGTPTYPGAEAGGQTNMYDPSGAYGQQPMYDQTGAYGQQQMYDQAPAYTVPTPGQVPPAQPPKKKKTGLIIGICAAAAVIIAAVLCIFVFDVFGLKGAKDQKSAEAVCKKMFKSMENADADALLECFPEGIDAALDIVDLNGSKTEIQTALDMMKGFGLTFKDITVDSAEKMDAEALKAELKESGADIKVKEAEKVHVKATMSVSIFGETQEETQEFIVICAKVGNKWYIINTEE